jgi:hypothetical protein
MTATTTESTSPAAQVEEDTESMTEACTTPAASAALPALAAIQAPAPVVAPYLGLVASVLCALGGGWLLLAPYALDIRRGAAKVPRTAAVELETGAAITAVALLSAIFFAAALFSRLRPRVGLAEFETEPEIETDQQTAEYQAAEPDPEPELEPDAEAESAPEPAPLTTCAAASNSSSALREMLTPLVAALAADLRSQDRGGQES